MNALNLANKFEILSASKCRTCGEPIAWATSKRTGRKYPCVIVERDDLDEFTYEGFLGAEVWNPHTCDRFATVDSSDDDDDDTCEIDWTLVEAR